tara:strand:- start:886 stop:1575 length:690 start_codon:yes stop_codon:yes gene_type:complete
MTLLKRIIVYLCLITFCASSQEEIPLNNPIYDNQVYHFGFSIGISNTKFQIEYTDLFTDDSNFDQILSKYAPGFNVGIIMDVRLGNNTNLRVTPSFNFSDQKIYFTENNIESTHPQNTGISTFEIPTYIKYRSDRINNGRAYLLIGGNFMLDLSKSGDLNQKQSLAFSKTNYSFDIGFGVDMYFAFFKFSPEIKYTHGLKNVLNSQDNEISNQINKLSTRGLLISLTFE